MDYYQILGVDRTATPEQISRAYKSKIRVVHPDRPGGSTDLTRQVIEARDVLCNREERRAHDEVLNRAAQARAAERGRRSNRARRQAARRAAEREAARWAAEREAARRAARQAAERETARWAAEQEAARLAAEQAAARRATEQEAARRAAEQEAARRAADMRRNAWRAIHTAPKGALATLLCVGVACLGVAIIADAHAPNSRRRRRT